MPDDGEVFSSPAGLDVGQATDVGRVREANEDALLTLPRAAGSEDRVLVAVADGMNDDRPDVYDAATAQDAWERTISFFNKQLTAT